MPLKITHVDAFTDKPFAGNPAAVCVLPEPCSEAWMQDVAREMNLSETAFLLREQDGFRLRWFTPVVEVELCGHATLASAHVLWSEGHLKITEPARFYTQSGLLTADRMDDWIELDFPAVPAVDVTAPAALTKALGVPLKYVGQNQFDYLVEVDSEHVLRSLAPDLGLLATIPVRGVIVTSPSASSSFDFVSRYFAPAYGINEDPVTGSAHCALGPHWQPRLRKNEFTAYQASARGGLVRVRLEGDRVRLGGKAVTVMRGDLLCL